MRYQYLNSSLGEFFNHQSSWHHLNFSSTPADMFFMSLRCLGPNRILTI